jgi:hypothetical protein
MPKEALTSVSFPGHTRPETIKKGMGHSKWARIGPKWLVGDLRWVTQERNFELEEERKKKGRKKKKATKAQSIPKPGNGQKGLGTAQNSLV